MNNVNKKLQYLISFKTYKCICDVCPKIQNSVPLYIVESLYANAVDEVLKEYGRNTLTEENLSSGRGHAYVRDKLIKKLLYWLEDKEEKNNNEMKESKKQMETFKDVMKEFLDTYYNKKARKISKKYDKLVDEETKKTDKYKAQQLLDKMSHIVINNYLTDLEEYLPSDYKKDDLEVGFTASIMNKDGRVVDFKLSESDKEKLNKISDDKAEEMSELKELVDEVKLITSTCECDKDFKDTLATYGIINKKTGKLII